MNEAPSPTPFLMRELKSNSPLTPNTGLVRPSRFFSNDLDIKPEPTVYQEEELRIQEESVGIIEEDNITPSRAYGKQ